MGDGFANLGKGVESAATTQAGSPGYGETSSCWGEGGFGKEKYEARPQDNRTQVTTENMCIQFAAGTCPGRDECRKGDAESRPLEGEV